MKKIHLGSQERKGACVIGAGLSGLIALKYLKAEGLDVLAVEAKGDVGGTWNRSQSREHAQRGIKELYGHYMPEIYDKLNTNVHNVFMTFRDMPLRSVAPTTIVTGAEFYEHVREYTDKFALRPHIRFNKLVASVRLTANLPSDQVAGYGLTKRDLGYRYMVALRDATTSNAAVDTLVLCDYIVCCNGTYASPFVPDMPERAGFTGHEMHTSDYTDMDSFRAQLENKRVVVVGSGISGRDMCNHIVMGFGGHKPIAVQSLTLVMSSDADAEVLRKAQANYAQHAQTLKTVVGPVTAFDGPTSLRARYGSVDADVVIWATGYKHALPFLEPTDNILRVEHSESRGHYMQPMFLRTFSVNEPTFAKLCDPFIARAGLILNFERQMSVVAAVFGGRVQLPSKEKMLRSLDKWLAKLRAHGHSLKVYCREVAGVNDLPTLLDKWFKYSGYARRNTDMDAFVEQTEKTENEYIDNGRFFDAPQLCFRNLPFTGDHTSAMF